METYHYRAYWGTSILEAARNQGSTPELETLCVPVYVERSPAGEIYHARFAQHGLPGGLFLTERSLGSLQETWCRCLTRSLISSSPRERVSPLTPVQECLLSLAVFETFVRACMDNLEEERSLEVRSFLSSCSDSSLWAPPLAWAGDATFEDDSLSAAQVRSARERMRQGVFTEVGARVVATSLAERDRLLAELVSGTWLEHMPLDSSDLLVGLEGLSPRGFIRSDHLLEKVLLAARVHRSEDQVMSFFRLPRWAFERLLQKCPDVDSSFQSVPWPEGVSLVELEALWAPADRSALCSLANAVETLRRA